VISFGTIWTATAAQHKRNRDPIAHDPTPDIFPNRDHLSGQFMTGDVRQRCDVGIVPLPAVPITPANAIGAYCNDHPIIRRSGIR
jgi:hypothetical protein